MLIFPFSFCHKFRIIYLLFDLYRQQWYCIIYDPSYFQRIMVYILVRKIHKLSQNEVYLIYAKRYVISFRHSRSLGRDFNGKSKCYTLTFITVQILPLHSPTSSTLFQVATYKIKNLSILIYSKHNSMPLSSRTHTLDFLLI